MASDTVRDRLVAAAFAAFDEKGYEQTTADEIAARAGVGRTTFFRTFRTKDEVAFPDHERIIDAVQQRLGSTTPGFAFESAREAAVLVIGRYVEEGSLARSRYRLTSQIPALRDREVANVSRYQRVVYEHFRRHAVADDPLQSELLAAAWVTVHNHVLRRWLRGATERAEEELREALDDVMRRLTQPAVSPDTRETTVAVFHTDRPHDAVLSALQSLLGGSSSPEPTTGASAPGSGRPRRSGRTPG